MSDLNYLKDNIISKEWKRKYEQCSLEIQKKLDSLDNMHIKEYQLQVIKRKQVYPEIGDVFQINPRDSIVFYGIVVNNHVNNNNGDDLLVIFIFKSGIDIEKSIREGVKKEDLLINPEIVGKEYWTRGYFYNVGHSEIESSEYGFYSIGKHKYCDEYGNNISGEPSLLGTYGVATISGIAYEINQEIIINNII